MNRYIILSLIAFLVSGCGKTPIQPADAIKTINNEWRADEYSDKNAVQYGWAQRFFFDKYQFSGKENVLDIGSGDGAISSIMATQTFGRVIGLDVSPDMTDFSKRNYPFANLFFINANAEDKQFYLKYPESFELITSFSTLHWVQDHGRVLEGIQVSLGHHGKAYLFFNSFASDPIYNIAEVLRATRKWQSKFNGYQNPIVKHTVESYREILSHYPLLVTRTLEEGELSDTFNGRIGLEQHVKSWLPHYKYLPPMERDTFVNELVDIFLIENGYTNDSMIKLPDSYLRIVLEKV